MNDNFDLKAYLGSKRLLTENFKQEEGQSSNIIRQLKPGQEYTWFMGMTPMKCTYIGKDERSPTYIFKLGNSTHKLSIRDVKDFIEPLSTYEEYAAENGEDLEESLYKGKHSIKKRLRNSIKNILLEKKKTKIKEKPEDLDLDSQFTKEPEEETEAPDIETQPEETPAPSSTAGFSKEEQEIQNSLKVAYDNAVQLGDQKLADQIGNTITYFTRSHIVNQQM